MQFETIIYKTACRCFNYDVQIIIEKFILKSNFLKLNLLKHCDFIKIKIKLALCGSVTLIKIAKTGCYNSSN